MVKKLRSRNKYQFFDYSQKEVNFKIIFIVGPCRSGKSSFGRLLGSLKHYFHIEENWLLLMLPLMCDKGLLSKGLTLNMYRAWINEIIYDTILMRTLSFRPSDHSYVLRMKSNEEIDFSLKTLKSRSDVDNYIRLNNVTIIFNLAEINLYIDLLKGIYPQAKIINIVRDPSIIADEVFTKGWFSDSSLLKPSNKQLFLKCKYKGKFYYIPFWVEERRSKDFIEMAERERAYFYSLQQYYLTAKSIQRAKANVLSIYYEDMLNNPRGYLLKVVPGLKETEKTKELLTEISTRKNSDILRQALKKEEREKINFINKYIIGFKRKYFYD